MGAAGPGRTQGEEPTPVDKGDGVLRVSEEGGVEPGLRDQLAWIEAQLRQQCRYHEKWRHAHATLIQEGEIGQCAATSRG
jgi:hypothetical protein